MTASRRLLAVVGATATGKSDLGAALAERFDGEIVSADAYQVYQGLDIGTAKPSTAVLKHVPHHLIDIASPADHLTLARFLDLAHTALAAIWSRGKLPVLVGGSGQYVWALLEGWHVPRVTPDMKLRDQLEALAAEEGAGAVLHRLGAVDPEAAARLDPSNVRRLIRAIEVVTATGQPLAACQTRSPIEADTLIIGLRCDRAELHRRIDARVEAMFDAGLVDEVRGLRDNGFGDARPVRGGIGYGEVSAYLDGDIDLEEAVRRTETATHRLARNQHAWFKAADGRIRWIDVGPAAENAAVSTVDDWMRSATKT